MFEIVGARLLETLHAVAKEQLGAEHACTRAIAGAVKSGAQADIDHAQTQLSELSPQVVAELMEAVHKSMREDPKALLDRWNAPGLSQRN